MRTVVFSAVLLVLYNASFLLAQGGVPMTVWTESGRGIECFILAVDNSVLYVDSSGQKWETTGLPSPSQVSALPLDSIQLVVQKRESRTASGSLLGLLFGASAGALHGLMSYKKPAPGIMAFDIGPSALGTIEGLLGGLLGATVGSIIGAACPKLEKYIDPRSADGFKQLKEIAMFGSALPRAIREALNRPIAGSH